MYRATAEIVDGLKVFAGGKWLTCIGNKNVRVGDKIWTDGRCVYGYQQENSSPIVITAPKEDWIIPALFYHIHSIKIRSIDDDAYDIQENYCSIYKTAGNKKHFSLRETKLATDDKLLISDYSNSIYVEKNVPKQYGWPYMDKTIAVNIDRQGNIYRLMSEYKISSYDRVFGDASVYCPSEGKVKFYKYEIKLTISKNNKIIKSIDVTPEIEDIEREAEEHAIALRKGGSTTTSMYFYGKGNLPCLYIPHLTQGYEFGLPSSVKILWGVIENENEWACIVDITRYIEALAYSAVPNYSGAACYEHSGSARINRIYMVTPSGCSKIYNKLSRHFSYYEVAGWSLTAPVIEEWVFGDLPTIIDKFPFEERLPIQDGYYFKIEDVSSLPNYLTVAIFNPSNTELWRGKITIDTYLTIYKNFLGADVRKIRYHTDLNEMDIKGGLYLLQNKQLNLIVEGQLKNQKLRPMKQYRNWWERIKILE